MQERSYDAASYLTESLNLIQNQPSNSGLSTIFAGLLNSKDSILSKDGGTVDAQAIKRIVYEASMEPSLSAPQDISDENMRLALALANILKDPTQDQKLVIDTMQALLLENASQSPDVKKAQDELLQAVANILIAQAIPDLFKEGDMSNVRAIFQDLNNQKGKIMMEYNIALDPYYKELKKILSKNMNSLQINNIISKSMMAEELEKLQPNEIDKIFEKLRKASNRSSEEEAMLKEEAKYRKEYLDPSRKILEEKMRLLMKDFTQRLSKVLEAKKK